MRIGVIQYSMYKYSRNHVAIVIASVCNEHYIISSSDCWSKTKREYEAMCSSLVQHGT